VIADITTALQQQYPAVTSDWFSVVNMTQVGAGVRVVIQVRSDGSMPASNVATVLVSDANNSTSPLYNGVVTQNLASGSDAGTSSTQTPTPTPTPTPASVAKATNWGMIGGIIGAAVVFFVVVGLVWWYCRSRSAGKSAISKTAAATSERVELQTT